MRTMQKGFTLIELVVVIAILGILAATALPRFVDLKSDANTAVVKGVAGGLGSASALNAAGCMVFNNVQGDDKCQPLDTGATPAPKCSTIGSLLNPAMTIGVISASMTVEGDYYVKADTALTTAGVPCDLVRGDGTAAGGTATAQYTGTATK